MSKVAGTEEDHQSQLNKSLLVGIGRKFKVAPFLEMQAIITYNFLYDNAAGVFNSSVGFKTGFIFKENTIVFALNYVIPMFEHHVVNLYYSYFFKNVSYCKSDDAMKYLNIIIL
ncbi:hypothetical protein [Fulvivirga lutimaris]|uniref:hypothetical protein n=1 Tax=Fulvivirga lutimaris TaxID=1819566 RepID=UPI0012BBCCDF|nr:hypothetical protein [Fulvivirga lutimaris]MTI40457.1 hypothetical protein [Fulvivirga lutimaris]